MWGIEQLSEPTIRGRAKIGLARVFEVPVEKFDETWRKSPVPQISPSSDVPPPNGTAALATIEKIARDAGLSRDQIARHFGFRRQAASKYDKSKKSKGDQ